MNNETQTGIALPLAQYRATFRVADEPRLPAFAGPAWRGAFGHALKHALCVTRAPHCPDCALYRDCGYAYVFETPLPKRSEKMRKYATAPHPFVLAVDGGEARQGRPYRLGFTLFGRGNGHFQQVAHALEQAGLKGVGGARGRFLLERVEQYDFASGEWAGVRDRGQRGAPLAAATPSVPATPQSARIELLSPLRLKRDSKIVGADGFRFEALFRNLLRRISMLSYFHTDQPLEVDFAALSAASSEVAAESPRLRWQGVNRYSSRQERGVKTGGLVGEFSVGGSGLQPFWPYLWLGQYTHAGAGTVMGMGRYRITTTGTGNEHESD